MDIDRLDWGLVPAFLAVAETGSLSAAARKLQSSQPTLGRQIRTLEEQLGSELFHRQSRGFALTEAGETLFPAARDMRAAGQSLVMTAAGQSQTLSGTVRITASIATSYSHLPRIIAEIRQAEPKIEIELVPSDETRNLLYREADIAIRMYRPTQLDLITRKVGDLPLACYASRDYIARHGMPSADTMAAHDVVGYDADPQIIEGFRNAGIEVGRHFFKTRCDDNWAYWELVRAGCGIGFAQRSIAENDPDMVEIDLGFPLPPLEVWLTAHEAMRQTPRVRRVWDMLLIGLKPLVS